MDPYIPTQTDLSSSLPEDTLLSLPRSTTRHGLGRPHPHLGPRKPGLRRFCKGRMKKTPNTQWLNVYPLLRFPDPSVIMFTGQSNPKGTPVPSTTEGTLNRGSCCGLWVIHDFPTNDSLTYLLLSTIKTIEREIRTTIFVSGRPWKERSNTHPHWRFISLGEQGRSRSHGRGEGGLLSFHWTLIQTPGSVERLEGQGLCTDKGPRDLVDTDSFRVPSWHSDWKEK